MCSGTKGSASGELLIETDRTRVWRWSFAARGDNTGWHRHDHDYVVIPLFDGRLDIDLPDGETVSAELRNGVPYARAAGVEHDVRNGNDFPCAFIEVEILTETAP